MPYSYGAAPPAAGLTTVGQLPLAAQELLQRALLPSVAAPGWPGAAVAHGPPPLSRATVRPAEAGRAVDAAWTAYPRPYPAEPPGQVAHTSTGDCAFSLSSGRVYPRTDSPHTVRPNSRIYYLIVT